MDVRGRDKVSRLARVEVELLETVEKVGPIAAGSTAGDVKTLTVVINNGVGAVVCRGDVLSLNGYSCS